MQFIAHCASRSQSNGGISNRRDCRMPTYDLLTSNFSTMSSTYQTILSGTVTVGEAGDAVTVHVTGQIGWMGAALYVVDVTGDRVMADRRPDGSRLGGPGR